MRGRCTSIIAAVLAPVCMAAQTASSGWQTYDYPDAGFAVQFPAPPAVTKGTYSTAGRTVPAKVYSVRTDKIVYTVTTADFSKTGIEGPAAIDEAVKSFSRQGDVRLDVNARINSQYGHELSVAGRDGARSMVGLFFFNHRLYQLEGRALPPDADASGAAAIRFQQSLQFPFN